MENKYLLLRAIAILFEIVGWLMLILGSLGTVLFVAGTGRIQIGTLQARIPLVSYWQHLGLPAVNGFAAAGLTALMSLLGFLVLCAIGELLLLLLDIEERTRETVHYLQPRM